jgi:hypothetical protein
MQSCSGNSPVDSPVAKTFEVQSGPVLQVFMSFTPESYASKLLGFTATVLAVDSRRLNASFDSMSTRDTKASVQVDIVTTNISDAIALQRFVDSRLGSTLTKYGLNILNISSKIMVPTATAASASSHLNITFAIAVGLGTGIPLILLGCFALYLHARSKNIAVQKENAKAKDLVHDLQQTPPIGSSATLMFDTREASSWRSNPRDTPVSKEVATPGIYLTTRPDMTIFGDEEAQNKLTAPQQGNDPNQLVLPSREAWRLEEYGNQVAVQQDPLVFLPHQHETATLQSNVVISAAQPGLVSTYIGVAPLESVQYVSLPPHPGTGSVEGVTPHTPIQAWNYSSLPGTVDESSAVERLNMASTESRSSLDGFWT